MEQATIFLFYNLSNRYIYYFRILEINPDMSVSDIPILPHELLCQSPIFNDNRWDTRPQFYRTGAPADLEWIHHPIQPPYDLNKYKTAQGALKPEVSPDPCIPYHTRYCSFNKTAWEYDHETPSLIIPSQPCKFRGKTTVPDISCLDQQELMKRDQLTRNLRIINST
jgi:hypothetical protein